MSTLKPFDEIIFGRKNVTTAGIAVILMDASINTQTLTVKANADNTGKVYVGDSTTNSSNGYSLFANEAISIDINHTLKNVYIDSDIDGEGVEYFGGNLA